MRAAHRIDTGFDFRGDTPKGEDPDASSATLKRYHRLLWSRALPSGRQFTLTDARPRGYLHHLSELGEYWMTSDAVVHTYRSWTRHGLPDIISGVDAGRLDAFERLSYTMGAMMLFPSWTGERHWSINQARGMLAAIADRMDLTLECVRRHYAGIESPMTKTFAWYADYFALFNDLDGFVRFFLLEDLLTEEGTEIRFFLPFDDFSRAVGAPRDVEEYLQYMRASTTFVEARNARIERWGERERSATG